MDKLIEHHIKYKEIHGVDETIWLPRSKHLALHKRLRQEGICKVPKDKLRRCSLRAYVKKAMRFICFSENLAPSIQLQEHIRYNLNTGIITISSYFRFRHKNVPIIIEKQKSITITAEMP